jgi:hypothetical protein
MDVIESKRFTASANSLQDIVIYTPLFSCIKASEEGELHLLKPDTTTRSSSSRVHTKKD